MDDQIEAKNSVPAEPDTAKSPDIVLDWKTRYEMERDHCSRACRHAEAAVLVARLADALINFQERMPHDVDGCCTFFCDDDIERLLRQAYTLAAEDLRERRWYSESWRPVELRICTCERDKGAKCSCS